MGLTVDYFYNLTPHQFQNIIKGYANRKDRETQERWVQTREVIYYNYLLTETKGSKKAKTKIMPLQWDLDKKEYQQNKNHKPLTQAELKQKFHKNAPDKTVVK